MQILEVCVDCVFAPAAGVIVLRMLLNKVALTDAAKELQEQADAWAKDKQQLELLKKEKKENTVLLRKYGWQDGELCLCCLFGLDKHSASAESS